MGKTKKKKKKQNNKQHSNKDVASILANLSPEEIKGILELLDNQHPPSINIVKDQQTFGKGDEVAWDCDDDGNSGVITRINKTKKTANIRRGYDDVLIKDVSWSVLKKMERHESVLVETNKLNKNDDIIFAPKNEDLEGRNFGKTVSLKQNKNPFKDKMTEELEDLEIDKKLSVEPLVEKGVRKTAEFVSIRCTSCNNMDDVSPVIVGNRSETYRCNDCIVGNKR